MTAYNIVGESPASAPVEVFVGEAGESVNWMLEQNPLKQDSKYIYPAT